MATGQSGYSLEAQEAKMDTDLEAQFAEKGVDPEFDDIVVVQIFYEPKPEWAK